MGDTLGEAAGEGNTKGTAVAAPPEGEPVGDVAKMDNSGANRDCALAPIGVRTCLALREVECADLSQPPSVHRWMSHVAQCSTAGRSSQSSHTGALAVGGAA